MNDYEIKSDHVQPMKNPIYSHKKSNTDKYIIKRTNKASGVYFIEIEVNNQYLNNTKLVIEQFEKLQVYSSIFYY